MRLEPLLDALAGSGAAAWTVQGNSRRRLSVGVKDGHAGNPHAPPALLETGGATLKVVWPDGRVGRAACERAQGEEAPAEVVERARQAACEDPDGSEVAGPAAFPEVVLRDPAAAAAASGDVEVAARRLSRLRETAAPFRTWSASVSASEGEVRVVTSRGLDVSAAGTGVGWWLSLDGEYADGRAGRAWEDEEAFERRLSSIADFAGRLRGPAAPAFPAGVRPVLLHPDVVASFVVGTLLDNLSGSAVAHGESAFRPEAFGSGAPVFREDLGLRNDPLLPLRTGSYRFTGEGLPAAACTYVERGRLATPVLDLKYARRLGRPTTSPVAGTDTLVLDAGPALSLEEAWASAGGGVLVLDVLGTHTQDPVSGDFSLSAPESLAIGPGGPSGRLRVTLSGNVFAALRDPALRPVSWPDEDLPGLLLPCHVQVK